MMKQQLARGRPQQGAHLHMATTSALRRPTSKPTTFTPSTLSTRAVASCLHAAALSTSTLPATLTTTTTQPSPISHRHHLHRPSLRTTSTSTTVAAAASGPGPTGPTPPGSGFPSPAAVAAAEQLVRAMDELSRIDSFPQLLRFLQAKGQLFSGPEVAAVVLQAANVSEAAAEQRMQRALRVAERRGQLWEQGQAQEGGQQEVLEDLLTAMGPSGGGERGEGGAAAGDGEGAAEEEEGGDMLDEVQAGSMVAGWAAPLLREHVESYPPDTLAALVLALAQLDSYDEGLMSAVATTFKTNPTGWLRSAAAAAAQGVAKEIKRQERGGGDAAEVEEEEEEEEAPAGDPWVALVTLVRSFAILGHYDKDFMDAVAEQAVALMPYLPARAEEDDDAVAAAEAQAAAAAAADPSSSSSPPLPLPLASYATTHSVVLLLWSFHELNHLHPQLLQATAEFLVSFLHQVSPAAACQVLLSFALFGGRNPPFYCLLLARVAQAGGIQELNPKAAGMLYRACVLIGAMGDVAPLSPLAALGDAASDEAPSDAASPSSSSSSISPQEAATIAAALRGLLEACTAGEEEDADGGAGGGGFPVSELRAAHLGGPSQEQWEQADEGLRLAYGEAGLLAVPEVLSALQRLKQYGSTAAGAAHFSRLTLLPPDDLTAAHQKQWQGLQAQVQQLQQFKQQQQQLQQEEQEEPLPPPAPLVTGGPEAALWVAADALVTMYGSGSNASDSTTPVAAAAAAAAAGEAGTPPEGQKVVRMAIKVLDDRTHCCANFDVKLPGEAQGGQGVQGQEQEQGQQARLRLRLRGPALSEVRCMEAWGWRVVVVPVGLWESLGPDAKEEEEEEGGEGAGRGVGAMEERAVALVEWLGRRLMEVGRGEGLVGKDGEMEMEVEVVEEEEEQQQQQE